MQVRNAGRDEIERVLRAAHAVRGGGLALEDYVAFHETLMDSAWGREHERLVVGCDDRRRLLAAVKTSSLAGSLDGRAIRIVHVRTMFTSGDSGDQHHAAELQEEVLEEARLQGHALAIRVSPAGGAEHFDRGFHALPCSEAACRTFLPAPWPKEPAWLRAGEEALGRVPGLRPGRPEDIDAIASIHAEEIAGQRLRIDRDRGLWDQIFLARETLRRMSGAADPFWVIERGGRVVAYVLLRAGPPTLRWREHGARREARAPLADLFWSALCWARGKRLQRIEGWCMPEVLTVEPLYPTSDRRRRNNLVMLRPLDQVPQAPVFAGEDECRLWELDAFQEDAPGFVAAP